MGKCQHGGEKEANGFQLLFFCILFPSISVQACPAVKGLTCYLHPLEINYFLVCVLLGHTSAHGSGRQSPEHFSQSQRKGYNPREENLL